MDLLNGVDLGRFVRWLKGECDGHLIYGPEIFLRMGFNKAFVDGFCAVHRSDPNNPKRQISKSGRLLKEVEGIHDLTFVRVVADSFDLEVRQFYRRFTLVSLASHAIP